MKYVGLAMGALVTVAILLALPSCGFNRRLVSITVEPPTFTFLVADKGQTAPYKAYGTYIHPPAYKDITDQVTWGVDGLADVVSIVSGTPPGTVTTGGGCGVSDVRATAPEGTGGSSNIVVGYATVTVDNPNIPYCPGGSTTHGVVTVSLAGSGAGTVTSSPAGIACPATACGAQFTVGDTIVLTATPNTGHTFTAWAGCTTVNGNTCSVLVVQGSTSVIATFN